MRIVTYLILALVGLYFFQANPVLGIVGIGIFLYVSYRRHFGKRKRGGTDTAAIATAALAVLQIIQDTSRKDLPEGSEGSNGRSKADELGGLFRE